MLSASLKSYWIMRGAWCRRQVSPVAAAPASRSGRTVWCGRRFCQTQGLSRSWPRAQAVVHRCPLVGPTKSCPSQGLVTPVNDHHSGRDVPSGKRRHSKGARQTSVAGTAGGQLPGHKYTGKGCQHMQKDVLALSTAPWPSVLFKPPLWVLIQPRLTPAASSWRQRVLNWQASLAQTVGLLGTMRRHTPPPGPGRSVKL